MNVSRTTVQAYLPYKKCVYNAKELSLNAERIRRYRERQKHSENIVESKCVAYLNYKKYKNLTYTQEGLH